MKTPPPAIVIESEDELRRAQLRIAELAYAKANSVDWAVRVGLEAAVSRWRLSKRATGAPQGQQS